MALHALKGSSRQFRGGTRRRRTGPTHPVRNHLGELALVAALSVVAASACGREPDSMAAPASSTTVPTTRRPETTTSTSTSSTTTVLTSTTTRPTTPEDEVRQTLATYWSERFVAANHPVDPNRPGLRTLLAGKQQDRDVALLKEMQARNQAARRPDNPVYKHRVLRVWITGDEATAWECAIDDTVVYSTIDDSIVDDKIATFLFKMTLTRANGHWQVSEGATLDKQEGVKECPVM